MSERPETFWDAIADRFSASSKAKRDFLAYGIAISAIILFVGTGGALLPQIIAAWKGISSQPDILLLNAMLLNIALIMLGFLRFRTIKDELETRRRSEEEARKLAEIDALTGCYNRRSINEAIAGLLGSAQARGQCVATMLIDLDNFKQVNDVNGHNTGDQVLKVAAKRLGDSLPADALLARLGGDEFACAIAFNTHQAERIEHLASLMIEKVAEPIKLGKLTTQVTMSVGIVNSADVPLEDWAPYDADHAQQLVHKADIAMYHSKKQGKNRFFWFESQMEHELRFRNDLESGIRKGVLAGEFTPFYEQQVDVETGRLSGFEMLARWESPEMGLVGPEVFIPVAEEIGVIADLSERLIAQAFEDSKEWHPDLTLSVNISPVQLRDPWFSQKLVKMLVKHNFPPSRLDIEITESCLHDNIGMVRTMITSLQNQGVGVSLDDFGTGYSSLAQLRSLPFDRIKIDRSFIQDLEHEGAAEKLVDAIVSMGEGLDMPITAEGIENPEILSVLKKMGHLKGQGYHYGKPEPADAVIERLAKTQLLAETADDAPPEERLSDSEPKPRKQALKKTR